MVDVIPRLDLNARVAGKKVAREIKLAFVTRDSEELD